MAGPEGFRKKTPTELRAQLRQAIAQLGGESLAPKGEERELLKLTEAEIKEKYPRRFEMYQSLLRGQVGDSNAWFGNSERGVSLGSLDISRMKKWLGALNNLDKYIKGHESGDSVTLKGRQATVFEDMRDFIEKGGSSGYVKLPTGTGKTVLFTEFVEALDLRTLIVVPTKLLVDQTEERLKQFAPQLDVGVVRSGRTKDLSKQCTVITYESLMRKLASEEIHPSDYDCLILDEAHVGLSDTRKSAIAQFNNTIKIGFTATPDFSATKGVGQLLGTEIHRMSIKEAVLDEGLLSGFQCILAKTETDLSKVKVIGGEKYDEKELEQAVNNIARNQAAIDLYGKMFKGEMAIAYCAGVQHATDLAQMFNERGVSAAVISGKTPDKEREDILRKYDEGEIKVLCNSDLLIAGFDQPKATACLNLRPTLSPVVAEQRGGRVLRVNDADEEKVAYIVDFVDKGHNPKHYPTLFAEVAEETALLRRGRLGRGRYKKLDVKIQGLEIETESASIADFLKDRNHERVTSGDGLSLEKLQAEVREAGIKTTSGYKGVSSQKGWPTEITLRKRLAEKGLTWDDFFGRDVPRSWSVKTLREEVRRRNITSMKEYIDIRPSQHGLPGYNKLTQMLKDAGTDYDEFFGRLTFDEVKKQVVVRGIKSTSQYDAVSSRYGWPSIKTIRKNLEERGESLDTFFNRASWDLGTLQVSVQFAGIKNIHEYEEKSAENSWPSLATVDRWLRAKGKSRADFFKRN